MKICLCFHNHQPVGNFDHVMESAYADCYLPMLETLEEHQEVLLFQNQSNEWEISDILN